MFHKTGKYLIITQCFFLLFFLFHCTSVRNEKTGNYEQTYFTTHGIMTDPGNYAYLYENIPDTVEGICSIVQGNMIHVFHSHRYGVFLTGERKKEVELRKIEDMLEVLVKLQDGPLSMKREPGKRFAGNCRHFALFTCSLLRHKKIPARLRCGFATYFVPGWYEDHWICEYLDTGTNKWIMIDPQIDNELKKIVAKTIDPLNLSDKDFLPAGKVWSLCSSGQINPNTCGLSLDPGLRGLWFVKENVFRDFLSLNKLELLPWDSNDFMEKEYNKEELILFEKIVKLMSTGTVDIQKAEEIYRNNPVLHMPEEWNP